MTRRLYIDWLRGIAVLLMILWHVVDAWTTRTGRDSSVFAAIVFLGGWAAPMFLFLAGLSLPLAGAARMQRGADRPTAARALRRRGWEVFGLAHLFRLQSLVFNPTGQWSAILKPDILNILGIGLVVTAAAWQRIRTARDLVFWLVVPAAVVVVILAPWSREWWWPTLLHPRLEAYIRPVGNLGVFTLFPQVAYMFVGAALGEWLARRGDLVLSAAGRAGAGMVACGVGVAALISPSPEHWSVPAVTFLWRAGGIVMMLTAVRELSHRWPAVTTGKVVLLGQHSLFVYWVHVELAYGVFSYPLHRALTLGWSLVGCAVTMWGMARAATVWAGRSARRSAMSGPVTTSA